MALGKTLLSILPPGCGALMPSWAAISVARRPSGLCLVADFRHQPPGFLGVLAVDWRKSAAGVFLVLCGISPLRNLLFQVGTSSPQNCCILQRFSSERRPLVETFNKSVRKLSKARAILVGGWEWE
jgi:hypothetical protein